MFEDRGFNVGELSELAVDSLDGLFVEVEEEHRNIFLPVFQNEDKTWGIFF